MPVPPEIIGPATLAIGQSIGMFSTLLPKFTDIKNGSPNDPGFVDDVRMGEIAAAAITLGVGTIASGLTNSPVPIAVALIMASFLIAMYEAALRYQRT